MSCAAILWRASHARFYSILIYSHCDARSGYEFRDDLKSSGGENPSRAHGGNPSPKGIEGSGSANNNSFIDQLSHSMTHIRIDAGQDDGWEVMAKKYDTQGGGNTEKQWGSWRNPEDVNRGTEEPHGNNWREAVDSRRQPSKENSAAHSSSQGWESVYVALPPTVQPLVQHGWQWDTRSSSFSFSSQSKVSEVEINQNGKISEGFIQGVSSRGYDSGSDTTTVQLEDGSDSDDFEDSDDDLDDDSDSDVSPMSHETRKKTKWFRLFFETLDSLSVDQINEPTRRWHCPACQRGPGSIAWYKGLQALVTHAKMKGAERIKLHRGFAELLEEELPMRGISVILAGDVFGQWKGLQETRADHDIVWPPMVVVMNTILEQDENDKWVGMGSPELLEYFPSYAAVKARHSYGPHGHRGMSVLIFEASPIGYTEAECLHKHFADEGKGREAWGHRRVLFYPGGKRQLYGFLACKEDMDEFNRHSRGRFQLKFEMRSHQEMVLGPMRQMSEDNRQFVRLKNNVAKLQQHSKTVGDTLLVVSQKLNETLEENRILRLRTKMQHEENEEEEKQVQAGQHDLEEERPGEVESDKVMEVTEVERILAESDRLEHADEQYKEDLMRRHLEDAWHAEKAINEDITRLMERAPGCFHS